MFAPKPEASMNLPVASHIDRLSEMVSSMRGDAESMEKELQILRGSITQLSYINKESDRELNSFLIDSIASLRNNWSSEWDRTQAELAEQKKKLAQLAEQHEDVEITREEQQERVMVLEAAVGLRDI
jgi:chromosome segregation ATPase